MTTLTRNSSGAVTLNQLNAARGALSSAASVWAGSSSGTSHSYTANVLNFTGSAAGAVLQTLVPDTSFTPKVDTSTPTQGTRITAVNTTSATYPIKFGKTGNIEFTGTTNEVWLVEKEAAEFIFVGSKWYLLSTTGTLVV